MILKPGDIAACFGTDFPSRLISSVTASWFGPGDLRWGPSHVALICYSDDSPLWVESTTLSHRPCQVRGEPIEGVQAHLPEDRIGDYLDSGGQVDIYRLSDIDSLSQDESRLLTHILIDHFVRRSVRYDIAGAALSGTRVIQLLRIFPIADLHELFCSELIAAVLMRLGRMNRENPTRFNPARLLRRLMRDGTYRRLNSLTAESVRSNG